MIRVFIADDQLLIRRGLRALLDLEPEIEITGEAADGDEAVRLVNRSNVDVMLLDIRMPKKNGIEVLRELSAKNELPPALILTTFDDADVVLDGVRAGASGFLLKDVSHAQLVGAIRAVAAGETVFQPAVTQRLLRASDRMRTQFESLPSPDRLTERETEVVRLMAGGFSNREIAHALNTAEGTIKNHVSSILSKFGVRDRTRAVLKALENGML
ncbi:MAG: response regulator [Thermoanaerobaculia bacterium]